ncbi:MAG: hypothetical protein JRD89_09305 [Deltaproteobacteria bacterium]|nr:hypothetical protein [Deltaproteobacteria bacterium]
MKRAVKAAVTGALVFLLALGGGARVVEDPVTTVVSAAIAGGIAFCLSYLRIRPGEVKEYLPRRRRSR